MIAQAAGPADEPSLPVRGLGPKLGFLYEQAILPTSLPAFLDDASGAQRDSALATTRLANRQVGILAHLIERQRGLAISVEEVAASSLTTFESRLLATASKGAPCDSFTNAALLDVAADLEHELLLRPADWTGPAGPGTPVLPSGRAYVFEVRGFERFLARQSGPVEDLLILLLAQTDCEIEAGEAICEAMWLPAAVDDRLFWPVPAHTDRPLACRSEPLHLAADFSGRPCQLTAVIARRRTLPPRLLPEGDCVGAAHFAAICTELRAAPIGTAWTAVRFRFFIDCHELTESDPGGFTPTVEEP